MDPGSTTADSIADRLDTLEAGPGIDKRFQRGVWDNLSPQGAKSRLVDKALTRLLRESDEKRALAYLDHWEGSLDPKCVLQLVRPSVDVLYHQFLNHTCWEKAADASDLTLF